MEDTNFRIGDLAIVFATLLGPILAVQTQKLLERRGEERRRQVQLFEDLMATRASVLSPRHIEALNAIPLVFFNSKKIRITSRSKLQKIDDEWTAYFDHLSDHVRLEANNQIWHRDRVQKLVSLLLSISNFLGCSFDRKDIENGIYTPEGPARLEEDHLAIIGGLAALMRGDKRLNVNVFDTNGKPNESTK